MGKYNHSSMTRSQRSCEGRHGVLLVPVQIDKVWSNQNGSLGDMSNNNYFTNQNSNNTGAAHHPFITMGFRSDGKGHAKAHITMPDVTYFKNKLLVQFAYMSSGVLTPVGDVASVANGTFDPTTNIATLTWDGTIPGLGASTPQDWVVVAGLDANGDGVLQPSEIAVQSVYKVRAKNSADYTADRAALIAAANTVGLFRGVAGSFLNAFCFDTPLSGAIATTTTLQITDSRLDVSVGALFQPNGGGSIHNYEFPTTSALSNEVTTSYNFGNLVRGQLQLHTAEVLAHNFSTDSDGTHTFSWPVSTVFFFDDNDPDLEDAMHGVNANFTLTARVRGSDKTIISLTYNGNITDLYDFDWPPTSY